MTEVRLTDEDKERLFQSINFFDDEADDLWPEIEKILADRMARLWDAALAAGMDTGIAIGEATLGLRSYPPVPLNPYRSEE